MGDGGLAMGVVKVVSQSVHKCNPYSGSLFWTLTNDPNEVRTGGLTHPRP